MTELTTPSMLVADRPLRLILEHTRGPWKGLREIVGRSDDLPDSAQRLPSTEGPFNARPDNREAIAGLVKVEHGYAIYREIDTPVARFDPRQQ